MNLMYINVYEIYPIKYSHIFYLKKKKYSLI